MNEFDIRAEGWDMNPMHIERSEAIAKQLLERIPLRPWMNALEFGAGTGITSFLLKDHLNKITMMDNSEEMVKIMKKKIRTSGVKNLEALVFDLENYNYTKSRFDLIFAQMALHHVIDIKTIIERFGQLLNPGGYLAIADLYSENGSFHGKGFEGHKGFDVNQLSALLAETGFIETSVSPCYTIDKKISDSESKEFGLFLLTARRAEQNE